MTGLFHLRTLINIHYACHGLATQMDVVDNEEGISSWIHCSTGTDDEVCYTAGVMAYTFRCCHLPLPSARKPGFTINGYNLYVFSICKNYSLHYIGTISRGFVCNAKKNSPDNGLVLSLE